MINKIVLILIPIFAFSVFAHKYAENDNSYSLHQRLVKCREANKEWEKKLAETEKQAAANLAAKQQEFNQQRQKAMETLLLVFPERADLVKNVFAATTQPSTQPIAQR